MLQEILEQGNPEFLKKLYDTYKKIGDENGIIDAGGKLIQTNVQEIDKNFITDLFDDVYKIISTHRNECRNIRELEGNLQLSGDTKKLEYVREYKGKYFEYMKKLISGILENLKKAIKFAHGKHVEYEAFLQLTLADYNRYLCEVLIDPEEKKTEMETTDKAYNDYFNMCEKANICLVSIPYMTGHYHYGLFQFEIKEDLEGAIKYLNEQRARFIDLLDTVFKNFTDSYDILTLITDTLTNWIILANSGNNENEVDDDNN